jgi:hypothetical protein
MPKRKVGTKRKVGKRKVQKGKGIFSSIGKAIVSAAKFVKKHKIISKTAGVLGAIGVPHAGKIGMVASSIGLGKCKTGKGLYPAGYRKRHVLTNVPPKVPTFMGRGKSKMTTTSKLQKQTVFP